MDDELWRNEKLGRVGSLGRSLWMQALAWSNDHLSDGFVPRHALPALASDVALGDLYARDAQGKLRVVRLTDVVDRLVAENLWTTAEGGYAIHDFHEFNESAEQVRARRQAKADRRLARADARADAGAHPGAHPGAGAITREGAHAGLTHTGAVPGNPVPETNTTPTLRSGVAAAARSDEIAQVDAEGFYPDEEPAETFDAEVDYEGQDQRPPEAPDQAPVAAPAATRSQPPAKHGPPPPSRAERPPAKPRVGNALIQQFVDEVRAREGTVSLSPRDAAAIVGMVPQPDPGELADAYVSSASWRPGRPLEPRFIAEDLNTYRAWNQAGRPHEWPPSGNTGRVSQRNHV